VQSPAVIRQGDVARLNDRFLRLFSNEVKGLLMIGLTLAQLTAFDAPSFHGARDHSYL
jgi:hypothetical protein